MVIEPAALVIETPGPAVNVVRVKPEPVPISIAPTAGAEDRPVPPLETPRTPVTPVVRGRPVAFVKTPEAGVPRAGVTNVGLLSVKPLTVVVVVPSVSAVDPSVMALEKFESSFASCVVPTAVPKV
jgi:hypothetical protein